MLPVIDRSEDEEFALVEQAQRGDREALAALLEPWRRLLFGYILRMVTHRQDAEDLQQEVLVRAMESLATFERASRFKSWLFSIATHVCLDHLRHKKRWRVDVQIDAEASASADPEVVARIRATMADPAFQFEIREHIAFCFSCVARTLDPEEQAALMLREVYGFSAAEAAKAMGVSQPVFGHRLSAARAVMTEQFEGLCALVGKRGPCWQCRKLREFAPTANRGADVVQIEVGPGVNGTPQALFDARIRIVREADLEGGRTHKLHDWFFEATTGVAEHDVPFR